MGDLLKPAEGYTPIWQQEQAEERERKRRSMIMRNEREKVHAEAKQFEKVQNFHPGLFKNVNREQLDPQSGGVFLVNEKGPDGKLLMNWTCCGKTDDNAPGCKSMSISQRHHVKCSRCGLLYMEVDNDGRSAATCVYHKSQLALPPDANSTVCLWKCCMKAMDSSGCAYHAKHTPMGNFKFNPAHASGALAPQFDVSKHRGGIGGAAPPSQSWKPKPKDQRKPYKKFKVKTQDALFAADGERKDRPKAADGDDDYDKTPIWLREAAEAEEREKAERALREYKIQVEAQAKQSMRNRSLHPGIFKTVNREQVQIDGNIILLPEFSMWTCCGQEKLDARACASKVVSDIHEKCSRCGDFYLEPDNGPKACRHHNGNLSMPPGNATDMIAWSCCMRLIDEQTETAKGCVFRQHVPVPADRRYLGGGQTVAGGGSIGGGGGARGAAAPAPKLVLPPKPDAELSLTSKQMGEELRPVILAVKELRALLERRAPKEEVTVACRTIVASVKKLDGVVKGAKGSKGAKDKVEREFSSFRGHVVSMMTGVRDAAAQSYADESRVKQTLESATAVATGARTVIGAVKEAESGTEKALEQWKRDCEAAKAAHKKALAAAPPPPPPGPGGGGALGSAPPPPPKLASAPPPPSLAGAMAAKRAAKKKGGDAKAGLFSGIQGFNKNMLKKAKTVDKSKPVTVAEVDDGDVDEDDRKERATVTAVSRSLNQLMENSSNSNKLSPIKNPKKVARQFSITTFLDPSLKDLTPEQRIRRLFEIEDARDRRLLEEALAREREKEAKWLEEFRETHDKRQIVAMKRETLLSHRRQKLLQLRLDDKNTEGKRVLDHLYVGSAMAAANSEWLRSESIGAVLNCTSSVNNEELDGVHYWQVPMEDAHDEPIEQHFASTAAWIEKHINEGCNVLVHCEKGRSRSCTIVVAFLMQQRAMSMSEAMRTVFVARPLITVNAGFELSLKRLHFRLYDEEVTVDDADKLLCGDELRHWMRFDDDAEVAELNELIRAADLEAGTDVDASGKEKKSGEAAVGAANEEEAASSSRRRSRRSTTNTAVNYAHFLPTPPKPKATKKRTKTKRATKRIQTKSVVSTISGDASGRSEQIETVVTTLTNTTSTAASVGVLLEGKKSSKLTSYFALHKK